MQSGCNLLKYCYRSYSLNIFSPLYVASGGPTRRRRQRLQTFSLPFLSIRRRSNSDHQRGPLENRIEEIIMFSGMDSTMLHVQGSPMYVVPML